MKELYIIFSILPREQYFSCAGIMIVMLLGASLEAVGIGAVFPFISLLSNPDFLCQYPYIAEIARGHGIESHADFIIVAAALFIVLYFLKCLYIAWATKLQIRFSMDNQISYAKFLLAEYLMKPYLFHVDYNTATLIRNISSGIHVTFTVILMCAFQLLTEFATALAIWVLLTIVDLFTAIVVAASFSILIFVILQAFRRRVVRQGDVQNRCSAQYMKWLNQGLGAIKETKIMHKEMFFLEEFGKSYADYGKAQGTFIFLSQVPRIIIEGFVLISLMFLVIAKTLLGESPESIFALLGVLALAAFRLMPSVNRIISFINSIKFEMPLFYEIHQELMDIRKRRDRHEQIEIEKTSKRMSFNREIVINHVGFRYPEMTKEVLQDVDFVIPRGAYMGIIGSSGAGKTTFVDILLGLFPPTTGNICVDGQDIQDNIRNWQENFAYVPQSIYLIDASIKENIALGETAETIDDGKIERVLRMAELYDFIQELPDGIDTVVGERGVKLSGGQRQRIGIARALYQDPKVLVLDEATSALDNATEKSITDTILKLKGCMTIISIAHRVSTLEDCDFKVEFEEGKAYICVQKEG